MKEILKLLQNEETINLGLKLICKIYNFNMVLPFNITSPGIASISFIHDSNSLRLSNKAKSKFTNALQDETKDEYIYNYLVSGDGKNIIFTWRLKELKY